MRRREVSTRLMSRKQSTYLMRPLGGRRYIASVLESTGSTKAKQSRQGEARVDEFHSLGGSELMSLLVGRISIVGLVGDGVSAFSGRLSDDDREKDVGGMSKILGAVGRR